LRFQVSHIELKGWIELEGKRLSDGEVKAILSENPGATSRFGGEFFLKWDGCMGARPLWDYARRLALQEPVVCNEKGYLESRSRIFSYGS